MQKVIIDCDPGHDDLFAIALARKFFKILAITTVAGNSSLKNTTNNALIAVDLFGLADVPVSPGAAWPLGRSSAEFTDAHGVTGLDGPISRHPRSKPVNKNAVDVLLDASHAYPGIWIIAIGPLTNIAMAIRMDPGFINRIAGISLMGGSATFGNVTAAAEYNVWFDPLAASEVFSSGVKIKMCGLDLTHQLLIDLSFAESLRKFGSDEAIFCSELVEYYHAYSQRLHGRDPVLDSSVGAALHDPCAVLALARPDLFLSEKLSVVVELEGRYTKGMTLVDKRSWENSKASNVEVMTRIDAKQARQVIIESFRPEEA